MSDYSSSTIDLTLEDDDVSLSDPHLSRPAYSHLTRLPLSKSHLLHARMSQSTPSFESSPGALPPAMSNGMANMAIQPPQPPQMNPAGSSQYPMIPSDLRVYSQSLSMSPPAAYRPAFAFNNVQQPKSFASPSYSINQLQYNSEPQRSQSTPPPPPPSAPIAISNSRSNMNIRNIIDLTASPSPEPQKAATLPADLPPKTPVCIGQLMVTALVLYPVSYLSPEIGQPGTDAEWTCVRLHYEYNPNKPNAQHTIHIKTPSTKGPAGEPLGGETFGVVEQKIATNIGPMMGKGLIRLEARVRKGLPNLPILPLILLVYTPKGNIPVVSQYLQQNSLYLDHPTLPFDQQRLQACHYTNPHNPPPGGYKSNILHGQKVCAGSGDGSRWTQPTVSGKSVEIQRSQMDDLFKSLKSGDELQETEPPPEVATPLYPHQKKALTFLLEREREISPFCGKPSSLWQQKVNHLTGQKSWLHIVTQKEIFEEPQEAKAAILADDMGLGKTITCVSLIASTLSSARDFASTPVEKPPPPSSRAASDSSLSAGHFAGSVWGMPDQVPETSSKSKAKVVKEQDKLNAEYARVCRIKANSRATLIVCPLSTVSNWEDQFREHWKGDVSVVGGCSIAASKETTPRPGRSSCSPIRVYVYHGNARKPDPLFLADFDAVITTYATLASEFSKQTRTVATHSDGADADEEDYEESGEECFEIDELGNQVVKVKSMKCGMKRKKDGLNRGCLTGEATSPLQSVNWFRVVLDEAHSIKETNTVGSKASCDLMADRRLCLTGTPVQNKLDDVFALIKFLRIEPLDEKSTWMEFIGTPVKYGQPLGIARLQTIMKCVTLRRTKESRTQDGQKILALPPRRDELRYLRFDKEEQEIYDRFFNESKAEFTELSDKNEVMKNYVGILQKILRLRQICDHFELVQKGASGSGAQAASYESIVAAMTSEGINCSRATAIFALLKEAGTTQCVECGGELWNGPDSVQEPCMIGDSACQPSAAKRGKKTKGTTSRGSTRQSSPVVLRPVLTRCQHLFCIECFRQCVFPGWPNVASDVFRSCSACQSGLAMSDAVEVSPECSTLETPMKRRSTKKEKRAKGMPLENFHPSTKIKALLGDLVQLSKGNPYSSNYDPCSVEVQLVDNEGNMLEDGVVKTIVFSQWTSMLDKIEDALEAAGIRYDRLDGTMKRDDRIRAMDALKTDPACEVLLVSLKAGGVGLNLTAAQRVYLMDPYWNPAVENQAVDRIHRLGQTKPVTTIKLIIENSIEARLLEVQRKKTALANMTLGSTIGKAELLQRRMEELSQLFGA